MTDEMQQITAPLSNGRRTKLAIIMIAVIIVAAAAVYIVELQHLLPGKTQNSVVANFTEIGLPSGALWQVDLNGSNRSSSLAYVDFNSTDGGLRFLVPTVTILQCTFEPHPQNGTVSAGSLKLINFTVSCPSTTPPATEFMESGLPQGNGWSVLYNGASSYATSTTKSINEVRWGIYNFSIAPVYISGFVVPPITNSSCVYLPSPASGRLLTGTQENITFANSAGCAVTVFSESGLPGSLPLNPPWNVTYSGKSFSVYSNYVYLVTEPGTYQFSIGPIASGTCVYTPSPSSGTLVAGSTESITFSRNCT